MIHDGIEFTEEHHIICILLNYCKFINLNHCVNEFRIRSPK